MIVKNILGTNAELSEDKKQLTETWLPIDEYEGFYEVSNFGRIKRLNTQSTCKSRWGGIRKISFKESVIRQGWGTSGYNHVTLSKNGKTKTIMVHRLVAKAFILNENNLPCVNHINGIKTDNNAINLEWVSFSANNLHKIYILGKKDFGQRKVINTETGEVYESIMFASKSIGLKYTTLQAMLVGRNKNHTKLKLC